MLIWVLDEVEAKKESEIQNPMEIVFLIAQVQRLLSGGVFFYNFFSFLKINIGRAKRNNNITIGLLLSPIMLAPKRKMGFSQP